MAFFGNNTKSLRLGSLVNLMALPSPPWTSTQSTPQRIISISLSLKFSRRSSTRKSLRTHSLWNLLVK